MSGFRCAVGVAAAATAMTAPTPHDAAAAIRARAKGAAPRAALVLGSGLGVIAESIADAVAIDYGAIPGFPRPGVEGHVGRLVLGTILALATVFVVSPLAAIVITIGLCVAATWARRRSQGLAATVVDVTGSLIASTLGTVYARAGRTMSTWNPPRVL